MSKSVYHETDEKASTQPVSKPGYYAVIPADVRYDPELPPNAKLLYGEISALLNAEGYCFASNAYFSDLYGVSERTITGLVAKLQKRGYIHVSILKSPDGQVSSRRIRICVSVSDGHPVENNFYTPRKNFREGVENNFQYTNLSNTNKETIKENTAKESSTGKRPRKKAEPIDPKPLLVDWIGKLPDLEAADRNRLYKSVMDFVQSREDMRKPIHSKPAVTALCNKLLNYADGVHVDRMVDMLDTAVLQGWQSVYPPKNVAPSAPDQEGDADRWL